MGDTVFRGYWENKIKTGPEWIRVSYWKKANRDEYLFVIANWGDIKTEATINLPESMKSFTAAFDPEEGKKMTTNPWKVTVPAHDFKVYFLGR